MNSIAAGIKAKANNHYSFVWNGNSLDTLGTTADGQFLIGADYGVGIGTNAPKEDLHVLDRLSSSAIFIGGEGTAGPHGIVLDDETEGQGVALFFRTGPNRLVLEPSSKGTQTDTVDAFYYDRDDAEFGFRGQVLPTDNNTYSLGSSGLRWTELFATNSRPGMSGRRIRGGLTSRQGESLFCLQRTRVQCGNSASARSPLYWQVGRVRGGA